MSEIVCLSPIDGREVAKRACASPDAIERALTQARAAQAVWARVPLAERAAKMEAFLAAMLAMNQEIVPELALMMGRPVRYGGEMRPFEERVRAMLEQAPQALAPIEPVEKPGLTRFIERVPLGVVLVIAPWNYPYLTAVNTIGPALVAGNAVILKHAAQTILAGERFAAAMRAADLPAGLFANLALTHEATARILSAGAVDHVNFTGSVEGGRAIERAAAGTFTSIGLELGGKDTAYIRADADLGHAVDNLVDGAFYNSGQCCCGIERIYVHERHFDGFVEAAAALTRRYVLGDPLEDATTLGPMATPKGAGVARAQIAQALEQGARALIDQSLFPADTGAGTYLAPQILIDVDHGMSVMREETFGPVVGVMKVKGDEEAIGLMNDSPYGLTAAIWTQDEEAARAIGERLDTGTVYMNRCDYLDPFLAWTGVKETGRGASLSRLGYEQLTRPRSFHLRRLT